MEKFLGMKCFFSHADLKDFIGVKFLTEQCVERFYQKNQTIDFKSPCGRTSTAARQKKNDEDKLGKCGPDGIVGRRKSGGGRGGTGVEKGFCQCFGKGEYPCGTEVCGDKKTGTADKTEVHFKFRIL